MEGFCGPDLDRGISTVVNDVGCIYNEVRALVHQHICHGQELVRNFCKRKGREWSLRKQSLS